MRGCVRRCRGQTRGRAAIELVGDVLVHVVGGGLVDVPNVDLQPVRTDLAGARRLPDELVGRRVVLHDRPGATWRQEQEPIDWGVAALRGGGQRNSGYSRVGIGRW